MKELLLSANKLSKTITKTQSILLPESIDFLKEQSYGLVGPSGAGKTTLARLLSAHIKPTQGSILFEGSILSKPVKSIQLIHQNPIYSFTPHLKLKDSLRILITQNQESILFFLDQLCLHKQIFFKYPHQLSGGEAQRVSLLRALLIKPSFLICDEITSNLDSLTKNILINFLIKFRAENQLTLLWISHDFKEVLNICDSILIMEKGRIIDQILHWKRKKNDLPLIFREYLKIYELIEQK